MQTTPDRIDPATRLDLQGIDSLMATELSVRIRQVFACDIPVMELTTMADMNYLSARVNKKINPAAEKGNSAHA